MRDIVAKNINHAGLKEREDVAELNATLQQSLAAKGLAFNRPDPAPFRDKLRAAGFYTEWKGKYGDEAWSHSREIGRQTGVIAGEHAANCILCQRRAERLRALSVRRLSLRSAPFVEILAAALVAPRSLILFSGVVSRYVFDRPLVWSDELASTLFLWLAMLGAVIAFRRDEHMRMTACVGMLPPPHWRAALDTFATGAALAFLPAHRLADLSIRALSAADHDVGA